MSTLTFYRDLTRAFPVLPELVRRDLRSRHADSHFGILWTFAQPLAVMLVMWLVLNFGLKPVRIGESSSHAAWLFTGMIAWNFISETLIAASGSVREYSFLVKKVNFEVSVLPIMKLGSGLWTHGIFLVLLVAFLLATGTSSDPTWIQLPYFTIAASTLILSTSWLFAGLATFAKDVTQGLMVLMQVLFWATPIFWTKNYLPEHLQWILTLNPAHYVVEGYRQSLLEGRWFFESGWEATMMFWGFCLVSCVVGVTVFRRLRPQFADVL